MQYFIEGLNISNYQGAKVTADTPIQAIKTYLVQNNLRGKVTKVAGRGNCTVTCLGQRKTVTNFMVTDLTVALPKSMQKKAHCIVTVYFQAEKHYKVWQNYLYDGCLDQFIAQAKTYANVKIYGTSNFWWHFNLGGKSLSIGDVEVQVIEVNGKAPKKLYLGFGELIKADVYDASTSPDDEYVDASCFYTTNESKFKTWVNNSIKDYKASICRFVDVKTFKPNDVGMWFHTSWIDECDKSEGISKGTYEESKVGEYKISTNTLTPQSFNAIYNRLYDLQQRYSGRDY